MQETAFKNHFLAILQPAPTAQPDNRNGIKTFRTEGIDLIAAAIELIKYDVYLVILGTGDEKYQSIMQKLQDKYKDRFSLTLSYSDELSRRIYSGSDIFLCPHTMSPAE